MHYLDPIHQLRKKASKSRTLHNHLHLWKLFSHWICEKVVHLCDVVNIFKTSNYEQCSECASLDEKHFEISSIRPMTDHWKMLQDHLHLWWLLLSWALKKLRKWYKKGCKHCVDNQAPSLMKKYLKKLRKWIRSKFLDDESAEAKFYEMVKRIWRLFLHTILLLFYCVRDFFEGWCSYTKTELNMHRAKYIILRPSELRYLCDVIPSCGIKFHGKRVPLLFLLQSAYERSIPIDDIAHNVVVLYKEKQNLSFYTSPNPNDPQQIAGWCIVRGAGCAWVLQTLEEWGFLKTVEVRQINDICANHWNRICGDRLKEGGATVDVLDVDYSVTDFSRQKKNACKSWKKLLKPQDLGRFRENWGGTKDLRLKDYVTAESCLSVETCDCNSSHDFWDAIKIPSWVIVTLLTAGALTATSHFSIGCETIRKCF